MVLCAGTALVDCIINNKTEIDAGNTGSTAENIGLYPGGEALNEAIILAKLGAKVTLSAAIGDDMAGKALKSYLSYDNLTYLSGDYSGATPVSILSVDATGNRTSKVSRVHDLIGYEPAIPDCSIEFATMASMFRPPFLYPDACMRYACKIKEKGSRLLADTKLPKGTNPSLDYYKSVFPLIDYITPNEDEALYYTHTTTAVDAAKVFRSYGVKNVIVKCGEKGSVCITENDELISTPAYSVSCIDAVGAGDNFTAGLIYSLINNKDLKSALKFATACAALSVTKSGAIAGVQSAEQVRNFIYS